jgi:hypothetical protein
MCNSFFEFQICVRLKLKQTELRLVVVTIPSIMWGQKRIVWIQNGDTKTDFRDLNTLHHLETESFVTYFESSILFSLHCDYMYTTTAIRKDYVWLAINNLQRDQEEASPFSIYYLLAKSYSVSACKLDHYVQNDLWPTTRSTKAHLHISWPRTL